jgi:hypothetical protein
MKCEALSTVLLSSFMLEYRLRRVLEAMGVQLRQRTTLGPLLDLFWNRLARVPRLDGNGNCAQPSEWRRCERTLRDLVGLRNALAHADYKKTLAHFGKTRRPGRTALKYDNAVVDAVRLINQGTGSDPQRNAGQRRAYFEPLKVRTAPTRSALNRPLQPTRGAAASGSLQVTESTASG